MNRLLAALATTTFLSTPALAQGYLNPPVYATGTIFAVTGVTGSTSTPIKNAYSPNNLNVYNRTAMSGTWHIIMPFPAFDGQIINIGCPGGDIAVVSTETVSGSGDTIGSGGPTSCTAANNPLYMYQFQLETNTWRFITASGVSGGGGGSLTVNDLFGHSVGSTIVLTAGTDIVSGSTGHATFTFPAFCPSLLIASPNATTNVSQLLACQGSTNQSIALTPKGTGGLSLATPDGSIMDPVGARSVDLQLGRNTHTQTTTGAYSLSTGFANTTPASYSLISGFENVTNGADDVIGGEDNSTTGSSNGVFGSGNTLTGDDDLIAGDTNTVTNDWNIVTGFTNHVAGRYSAVFGSTNTLNSDRGLIAGDHNISDDVLNFVLGDHNTVTGNNNVVGGHGHTVAGNFQTVFGDTNVTTTGKSFTTVLGQNNTSLSSWSLLFGANGTDHGIDRSMIQGGDGNNQGQVQAGYYVSNITTTDGGQHQVLAPALKLPNGYNGMSGASYAFDGQCVAADAADNSTAAIHFHGSIKQGATAATTAIPGTAIASGGTTPFTPASAMNLSAVADLNNFDASLNTAKMTLSANTTVGSLEIAVDGIAGHNINWSCAVKTAEQTH